MVDVNGGFIKSIVFAVVVITICCYQGYYTHLRSDGEERRCQSFNDLGRGRTA